MTGKVRMVMVALMGAFVAVALLMGAGRLWASTLASETVPEVVNYQGFLTDAGGVPISGSVTLQFSIWDASSAGSQVWNETHNNVPVSGGYFSVLLGSQGTPLTVSVFSSSSRYLEVTFNGTTFARQRLASVPYALVAHQAQQATEAITSTYATTATYALNGPGGGSVAWSHVVVVAKSGGDYTTVTDAMNAISPTVSEPYLVLVMPGVYEEQVTLKSFVHLKGAGPATTVISSQVNNANFNNDAAATMLMQADAQLSDLTVRNNATSNDAVALKILNGNSNTVLNNVGVVADGAGGGHHIGLYVASGDPQLKHVSVEVSGATTFNRGINSSVSTLTIHDSTVAASGIAPSGINIAGGGPTIQDSVISGKNGTNGNALTTNGAGGDVHINRSSMIGDTGASGHSIFSTDNINFFIGASLLEGTALANDPNRITCSQDYDENYVDLNADCQ